MEVYQLPTSICASSVSLSQSGALPPYCERASTSCVEVQQTTSILVRKAFPPTLASAALDLWGDQVGTRIALMKSMSSVRVVEKWQQSSRWQSRVWRTQQNLNVHKHQQEEEGYKERKMVLGLCISLEGPQGQRLLIKLVT